MIIIIVLKNPDEETPRDFACPYQRRKHFGAGSRSYFEMRPVSATIYASGAAGRNRTDMAVKPHDFESCVSASSTTAATSQHKIRICGAG